MPKINELRIFDAIQSLFFYGAGGLCCLGLYINQTIGTDPSFFPILWVAGSVFVYNLDRLIPDPADQLNTPERLKLAPVRKWILGVSLAILVSVPVILHAWHILILLIPAVAIGCAYSFVSPGIGHRVKDFPWLKWLLPPVVIMISLTAPVWTTPESSQHLLSQWPMLGCLLMGLLINILLFDQRDRLGDSAAGAHTIATLSTTGNYRLLMMSMLGAQIGFLFIEIQQEMLFFTAYTAALIYYGKPTRPHWFYDWLVDGMLYIPLATNYLLPKV